MPETLSLSAALALAGSALALLLGAALWVRAANAAAGADPAGSRRARAALRSLAVSFVAAGLVGAAIAISHGRPASPLVWLMLEQSAALAASAAFLRFAWLVCRNDLPGWLTVAIVLPPVAGVLAPLLLGPRGYLSDAAMLGLQFAYATASVGVLLAAGAVIPRSFVWRRRALALFVLAIHAAQWARWLRPDVALLRNVVPLTIAAAFAAMAWIALRSAALDLRTPSVRTIRPLDGRGEAALAKLERSMAAERPYLEPGLTASDLAQRLGLLPDELTQATRLAGAAGVPEYLTRLRVAEAKRLLENPRHDQLTVDAIGTRSGFASRSVFYDSFRRLTGMSPAVARRDRRPPAATRPETPAGRPDSENPVGAPLDTA